MYYRLEFNPHAPFPFRLENEIQSDNIGWELIEPIAEEKTARQFILSFMKNDIDRKEWTAKEVQLMWILINGVDA